MWQIILDLARVEHSGYLVLCLLRQIGPLKEGRIMTKQSILFSTTGAAATKNDSATTSGAIVVKIVVGRAISFGPAFENKTGPPVITSLP